MFEECAPAFLPPNLPTLFVFVLVLDCRRNGRRVLASLSYPHLHSWTAWALLDAKGPWTRYCCRDVESAFFDSSTRFLDTGSPNFVRRLRRFFALLSFANISSSKLWNGHTVLCSTTQRFAFRPIILVRPSEPWLSLTFRITFDTTQTHTSSTSYPCRVPSNFNATDFSNHITPRIYQPCPSDRVALWCEAQGGTE